MKRLPFHQYPVLFILICLLVGASPVHALEQMSNASFTTSAAGWAASESVGDMADIYTGLSGGAAPAPFNSSEGIESSQSYLGYSYENNTGPSVDRTPAYGYLQQSILSGGVLASPANVEIGMSYKARVANSNNAGSITAPNGYINWDMTLTGGFYNNSTGFQVNAAVIDQVWSRTTAPANTDMAATPWADVATWTSTLPAGASYSMRLQWKFATAATANKFIHMGCWIDRVSVNISPCGLTASETTGGLALLSWPASTNPANTPPLAIATHCYRIYRSTTSGGPWSLRSSTSSTSWSEDPAEDAVYYCITDVDRTGRESPKSVQAVFKRAKIQITKVEVSQTTVTRGQSGLPVNVYLSNTGDSPASFDGASLTFKIPAVGHYTWSLTSPAAGTVIPANGSIIVQFSINILSDSICDIDTIDATASATSLVSGRPCGDIGSDIKANWLIRAPASLRVVSVVTPATVYLGQTEVPVDVTVENVGDLNAAGLWDSSTLKFTHGSYLNIAPPAALPATIYAGLATTCRYLLEVDPTSATGPATIDAWISYRDINLQIPTSNNDGALTPGNWTIVAGLVNTYKDAARLIKSSEFNQGYYTVFARAENLTPLKEHRLRLYDPNGVQVAYSDPAVMTDENGDFEGEFELTPASPAGIWRIVGTRVFDSIPLCENTFTVGAPASATLSFQLPSFVSLGSTFIATLTFSNVGSATLLDAEPASLTWASGNTGTATLVTGPSPLRQDISGESSVTFIYSLLANTTGNFQLLVSGFGFDANATSTPRIQAATTTSNLCVIQTPANLSITGLSEPYVDVAKSQEDLVVTVTIANTGQAGANIDAATLSLSLPNHSYTLASPTSLPFLLPGGKSTSFVFYVDVSPTAAVATYTFSASLHATDVNNPSSELTASGGSGAWHVANVTGVLSANSGLSPEQYFFSAGQRVYCRFTTAAALDYGIWVYRPNGTELDNSGKITSAIVDYYFETAGEGNGTYRVDFWDVKNTGAKEIFLASLYFTLQSPSRLSSTLTLSPPTVEIGATVTATLFVQNPVSGGSTFSPTTPTNPVAYSGSTGELSLVSGPTPPSADISPDFPATFTWTYLAIASTSAPGCTMVASATGTDLNTSTTTTTSDISNTITIVSRNLALASSTIDFGSMDCNSTKTIGYSRVDNTGNAALTNVSWQSAHLLGSNSQYIDRSNVSFSPISGFGIALSGSADAAFTLSIPYNKASGTYIATFSVWDDYSPTNLARDVREPFDEFSVRVTVNETKLVKVNEDLINLGNWPPTSAVATKTVTAFNGGNVNLTALKFIQTPAQLAAATLTNPLIFTPPNPGTLATNGMLIASISTFIDVAQPAGIYISTYTLLEDTIPNGSIDAGETYDTFQLLVRVGTSIFTVSPDTLNLGNGTPTYTITDKSFSISNTGTLALTQLKLFPGDLVGPGGKTIPAENLSATFQSPVSPSTTGYATMSLYVAAGVPTGVYTGTQIVFEDLDGDGTYLGDPTEALDGFIVQVTVNPYGAIDVINATVNMGGRIPGESGSVNFSCRNIGSIDLTGLLWEKTNLLSAADSLASTAYSFLAPAGTIPGQTFTATLTFTIPDPKTDGDYFGQYGWLFNDNPVNGRDVSDPQDKFTLYLKIGAKSVNIIEDTTQITGAAPYQTSPVVSYSINNTGLLVLARPVATITANLVSGGTSIPTSSVILSPIVFSYMNPGQSKTGTWQVQIPANTPPGTYVGTLKVWNDENANGLTDSFEASDTMTIKLGVDSKAAIAVVQDPLDLFFVPAGQSKTGTFEIKNVGNVDLSGKTILASPSVLAPIAPGPTPIPAPSFTITTPALFPANGSSFLATVSVSVPLGQAGMPYSGSQKIFADLNGNGLLDVLTDAYTSFLLKLTVGEKKISADTPLLFGSQAPGTTPSLPFKIYNLTAIGISSGRWSLIPMPGAGGGTYPTSAITMAPNPFTVNPSSDKACTITLNIPTMQAADTYLATFTAFEDENANSILDGFEASATFQVGVTVTAYPRLQIVPALINAGTITAGETSPTIDIPVYNAGNATFSSFAWTTSNLVSGGNTIPSGLFTFTDVTPGTLSPGQYGTATVAIGPVDVAQPAGTYTGSQLLYGPAYYPGSPGASDSVLLSLTVNALATPVTGPDVGSGSTYQEVATSTFSAPTPNNRFILSAWVCPGTGTAAIGFFRADENGAKAGHDGAMIGKDGVLKPFGNLVEAGILESRVARHPRFPTPPYDTPFTWHRIYVTYDYTFSDTIASTTWIVLQNQSPTNASYSVWFDGVQLEKPVLEGQTRPTVFAPNKKIVAPSRDLSLDGEEYHYEW
ncbi:MAG TPA: hypothetical protein VIV61_05305 [Candidatus Ozemobacteraceae bacterium]